MIIIWFIFSFVIACFASDKRIGFFWTFLISIFFSPIIGLVCCIFSESDESYKNKQEMYKYFKEKNKGSN